MRNDGKVLDEIDGQVPDGIDLSGFSHLFTGYNKSIRPALDAVDEIRAYVKNIPEISEMLPAIVIVGEQSSGKSSLIESISGIGLPRGNGMCTKVPLELQLRKSSKESITMMYTSRGGTEYHTCDLSFDEISAAIESATKAIVGTEKAVKDQPITLKICSPEMKDLTLIDLPGTIPFHVPSTDSYFPYRYHESLQ